MTIFFPIETDFFRTGVWLRGLFRWKGKLGVVDLFFCKYLLWIGIIVLTFCILWMLLIWLDWLLFLSRFGILFVTDTNLLRLESAWGMFTLESWSLWPFDGVNKLLYWASFWFEGVFVLKSTLIRLKLISGFLLLVLKLLLESCCFGIELFIPLSVLKLNLLGWRGEILPSTSWNLYSMVSEGSKILPQFLQLPELLFPVLLWMVM